PGPARVPEKLVTSGICPGVLRRSRFDRRAEAGIRCPNNAERSIVANGASNSHKATRHGERVADIEQSARKILRSATGQQCHSQLSLSALAGRSIVDGGTSFF